MIKKKTSKDLPICFFLAVLTGEKRKCWNQEKTCLFDIAAWHRSKLSKVFIG